METQRVEALASLRTLVQDEKDLFVGSPIDDNLLLQYLHYANFNVDEAFEKMKVVYSLKAQNSEWYAHRRDPAVHDVILKKGVHLMLDNRDQLGRRIYLLRLGNLVYGAHEPHEMFQVDDLWLSLALDEEETQKNGLVMIFDMEGMPWKFLRYFTPHIVRVTTTKAENIPVRNIQFHVVNPGLLLHTVIQLVFPFLSQATKEQVFFHKKLEGLHAHVSPSALPVEYGGERPALDPSSLAAKYLDARNNRIAELLSYGYNVTK
ncbi:alpha-tocopherol transfer protein-like isoform X2 [Homalodisca vitripennis]|uniref:CRAL-TRIO domain-containing protein n=1 Tax=Homalodisca liturata TaxID=320908 RepID=A0A1B6J2F5_9HEMI|nr:alpha-tocopherol transfer protein-like isoform X2 [Homalodisca vitripennis]